MDFNALNLVALADFIYYFQSFYDLAKAGVMPVQVGGVVAAVTDKELAAPGIPAGVSH